MSTLDLKPKTLNPHHLKPQTPNLTFSAGVPFRAAAVHVLLCNRTGTLTTDALELRAVHVTAPGASPHDVLVAAALASRWDEPARNAVDAMVLAAVDTAPLHDSYLLVEHRPFDPRDRRTASTLRRQADGGSCFRARGPSASPRPCNLIPVIYTVHVVKS